MDCVTLKKIILLPYLILFTDFCLSTNDFQAKSKFIIARAVTACPSQNRLPTKLTNLALYNKHGMTIVNVTAEFTETLKAPLEIKVEGQRCEIHRMSQCISIPGINYDKFCSVFGESYYGKTYFGKAEPPIKSCPINKVKKL